MCVCVLTGKQRIAHKPHSKPKLDAVFDLKEEAEENIGESGESGKRKGVMTEEELWDRLDELEKLEELQDEQDRYALRLFHCCPSFSVVSSKNDNVSWKCFSFRVSDHADMNGEDTSSSSSEEEKEADCGPPVNGLGLKPSWSSVPHSKLPLTDRKEEGDYEEEECNCLPTIFFSHTVEPKKVSTVKVIGVWQIGCEKNKRSSSVLLF